MSEYSLALSEPITQRALAVNLAVDERRRASVLALSASLPFAHTFSLPATSFTAGAEVAFPLDLPSNALALTANESAVAKAAIDEFQVKRRPRAFPTAPRLSDAEVETADSKQVDRTTTFRTLEQWTGTVLEVDPEARSFAARVVSATAMRDELADFVFDEVSDDDHELIKEGAIFYWSIGYEVSASKQRSTASVIRFRRVHFWKRADVEKAVAKGDELAAWLQHE